MPRHTQPHARRGQPTLRGRHVAGHRRDAHDAAQWGVHFASTAGLFANPDNVARRAHEAARLVGLNRALARVAAEAARSAHIARRSAELHHDNTQPQHHHA
jgi:hypothetical protein